MVSGLTRRRVKRWAVHGVWACRPGEAMAKHSRKRETEEPHSTNQHSRKRETEEPQAITRTYGRGKPKDLSQAWCQSWVNFLGISRPGEERLG